jgi:choline dehydrogenase-like flavoprotein
MASPTAQRRESIDHAGEPFAMTQIVVVGSGASAVHFALSALEKGHEVVMLDVGRRRPASVLPDASLIELKARLDDAEDYFLGTGFEAVLFPGTGDEYYGIPPSKNYVFDGVPGFRWHADGFRPLASFAQGGLAEAWTGGVYPFNDAELADFPFSYDDIAPYYDLVADRIGISGAVDDLARFMPVHQHLMPPLRLDEHSKVVLDEYEQRRARLNQRHCYMGRSRIATISRDKNGRKACDYLGRCLWGCPSQSLYTPLTTLDHCRRYDRFRYVAGVYVKYFKLDRRSRIAAVVTQPLSTEAAEEFPVENLVLAAGTLSSCRIFLESVFRSTGELLQLGGLMDNQQILMPFVNLTMLGRPYSSDSYQYHQVGMGLEGPRPQEYVHGQITTLKTAMIHPIVQALPFDMRTALAMFGDVHAALGLVNVNLHDTRRLANVVTLEPGAGDNPGKLLIHYRVTSEQLGQIRVATRRVRSALWALNCIVPPRMSHVRPIGASVHYAGLLPMSETPDRWTTSKFGQSHDYENLFFADGTTFPFLPAKNLTFTLMANAARIADAAF